MSFSYNNNSNTDFKKLMPEQQIKDKNFFCSLGDSFMLKNEYRKAVKEYLVSLMMDKSNVKALKGASKAYKSLQEYAKAIKYLKNANRVFSFDSEVYYELGLNYLLSADNENARKNFMRSIKLCPHDKNAQLKLALTHELAGEEDMAILIYDTIIEKHPTFIPALIGLASIYLDNEDFEKAIVLYKKVLKVNSEYYRAYLGMGFCFDGLKRYSHAIRYYKKYIAAKPHSPTARSLVSRIYEIHDLFEKKRNKKRGKKLRVIENTD